MEMITISCPACGFSRQTDPSSLPRGEVTVTCPQCKTRFRLPDSATDFSFEKGSANESAAPPADEAVFRFAGFWIRLIALTIDGLLWLLLFLLIAMPLGLAGVMHMMTSGPDGESIFALTGVIIVAILVSIASIFYYIVSWAKWGKTLGMRITGIKVVDRKGALLSGSNAFLRWLTGYLLPGMLPYAGILAYMALGIMVAVNGKKQGWHDLAAKSYVVYG